MSWQTISDFIALVLFVSLIFLCVIGTRIGHIVEEEIPEVLSRFWQKRRRLTVKMFFVVWVMHSATLGIYVVRHFIQRSNFKVKHKSKASRIKPNKIRPPKLAEYLLYFLPKSRRDPILGDMEEMFELIFKSHGKRKAQIWYWAQTLASFAPLLHTALKRFMKWGIVAVIGRILARFIPWEQLRRYIPWDWFRNIIQ